MSSARTLKHAPYLESAHKEFLDSLESYTEDRISPSPFADYMAEDIDSSYLGIGLMLSDYASLYEVYGEYMLGFSFESAWKEAINQLLSSEERQELAVKQRIEIDEDVELKKLPSYSIDMREANVVGSSSFVIGKSCIEDLATKAKMRVSTDTVVGLIPELSVDAKANWQQDIARKYAVLFKHYYSDKMLVDERNYDTLAQDTRWPFTVMDYERKGLAAFHPNTKAARNAEYTGLSKGVVMVLGIATVAADTYMGFKAGAAIGSYFGPVGTLVGGIIGAVVGFFVGIGTVFHWW
jgi:hypothetical protein